MVLIAPRPTHVAATDRILIGGANRYVANKEAFNHLAPDLFFFILAQAVYKMWIIQEQNKLALWIKLHFEEKKRSV